MFSLCCTWANTKTHLGPWWSWDKGPKQGQSLVSFCFLITPMMSGYHPPWAALWLQNPSGISAACFVHANAIFKASIWGKGESTGARPAFLNSASSFEVLIPSLGPDLYPKTFTLCGQGDLTYILKQSEELPSNGFGSPWGSHCASFPSCSPER